MEDRAPRAPFSFWSFAFALSALALLFALERSARPVSAPSRSTASKWFDLDREPKWGPVKGLPGARAQVLTTGAEKFTLLYLTTAADPVAWGHEIDDLVVGKMVPGSNEQVYRWFNEQIPDDAKKGYFEHLARFNELLENRMERILLFKGEGFNELIGTLEFTYRDKNFPLSPLEQAKGIRIPEQRFVSKRVRGFPHEWERVPGVYPEPVLEHFPTLLGSMVEVNKLSTHPDFRGIAAPMLWTAAIMENAFNGPARYVLNRKQRKSSGIRDKDTIWKGEDAVMPSRMEIRPNRRMIPYFEALGFKLDKTRYPRLPRRNWTKAAEYSARLARESKDGKPVDDVLMWISQDDWLEIPRKLLAQGKEGAKLYIDGVIERMDPEELMERIAYIGLSPELEAEARAEKELWSEERFEKLHERARRHQERLEAKHRHWLFRNPKR